MKKFKQKHVRLSVAPIAWINDDIEELSSIYTLDQCLQETAEAGYVGTEAGRSFPTDPKLLGAKLAQYNLVMSSGWWSGQLRTGSIEEEKERIEDYLNLFSGVGTNILFYGEIDGSIQGEDIPLSERPIMSDNDFKAYGKKLNALSKHCRSYGIRLCIHHHMGTIIQTAADVNKLMAATNDDLGLLVDTGHIVFAGDTPEELVKKHANRIMYIHCKDLRKEKLRICLDEDWAFTKAIREGVFTVPGDGHINFDTFLESLATIKYGGWLVVEAEQDPRIANPRKYAILGREHLEPLIDKHGFSILDEHLKTPRKS